MIMMMVLLAMMMMMGKMRRGGKKEAETEKETTGVYGLPGRSIGGIKMGKHKSIKINKRIRGVDWFEERHLQ